MFHAEVRLDVKETNVRLNPVPLAAVSCILAALACAVETATGTAPAQPVVIEHASMTSYPKAECTKIHVYLKNLSPYPVLIEGVYLGDTFLDLDPARLGHGDDGRGQNASLSAMGGMHGHRGRAEGVPSGHAVRSVQWCRALPNPIEPTGIGGVTVSLWGAAKDASLRISLRGAGELRWDAREEKPALRLSHVAFDPTDPNKMHIYCENMSGRDIVIDRVLVNTESLDLFTSIPTGNRVKAGKKTCFIVRPKQRMLWGKYAGIGVVGKDGDKAFSVARVVNYFPVGSWSVDTRAEMFFDAVDIHKPMPDAKADAGPAARFGDLLQPAAFGDAGRPCQAFYDGRDPTCDVAGWTRNAERIIAAMSRLGGGSCRIPYYTHVCSPQECEYAFFAELPDLAFVNPYTLLFRAVSPWESGVRIERARTWADPRPVIAVPEAFRDGKADRDLCPDEISFALWNEVAAGAKGVRYFTRNCSAPGQGYAQMPGAERRMARDNLDLQLLKGFLRIGDTFPVAWASEGELACKAVLCGEDALVLFLFNKRFTGGKKSMSLWNPQGRARFGAEIPKGLTVNRIFHADGGFSNLPFRNVDGAVELDLPPVDTTSVLVLTSEGTDSPARPDAGMTAPNGSAPGQIVARYQTRARKLAAPLLDPAVAMGRDALIDLARRLREEKDTALKALRETENAVSKQGAKRAEELSKIASAYLDLGCDEDAFALCRRPIPNSEAEGAETLCRRISARALAAGNYRTAIRCMEALSSLTGDREARRDALAELVDLCDGKLRNSEETLKWIEAAVNAAGGGREGIARLRVRAAQICLEAGRADEAMRHLRGIDRAEWPAWNVDYHLGCAFVRKAEARKAIEHLRSSVVHREPMADQAQFLIGWLLLTGGDRAGALAEFRRLDERFPASPCVRKAKELTAGQAGSGAEATARRQ